MFLILFLSFFLIVLFMLASGNIHIKWKTFLKKGFKKLDNNFGVVCFDAKQGKGKTFCAVEYCEEEQERTGCEIITNVKSYFNYLLKNKRKCKFFSNLQDMIYYVQNLDTSKNRVLIFYDEIFTTLSKSGSLQPFFLSFLSQLRKRKIMLVTTAQEWSEINITFRRYVRFQVVPNMFPLPIFKTAFIIKDINDGDLIHWDNDLQDFVAPTIERSFQKANLDTILKYDTFETIATNSMLNHSSRKAP